MKSINYLDEAKKKLGIESDYALAKQTGISQMAISHYRTGRRVMDDYTAAVLADILEIDPIEVIATANSERERTEEKRAFWRKLAQGSRSSAIVIALIIGGFQIDKIVSDFNDLYIMRILLGAMVVGFLFWSFRHAQKTPN